MWTCPCCNEQLESTFERCWNCGADSEGIVDPDFQAETDAVETYAARVAERTAANNAEPGGRQLEVARLICKSLALLLFAQAAYLGGASVLTLFLTPLLRSYSESHLTATLVLLFPVIATVAAGIVFWAKSDSIARSMLLNSRVAVMPDDSAETGTTDNSPLPVSLEGIMLVAFITAGVFLFVAGAREMLALSLTATKYVSAVDEFWYDPAVWQALLQLALSLWLILGSQGIVRLVFWLRTTGTPAGESGDCKKASDKS